MRKLKSKRTKIHIKITELGLTDPLKFQDFMKYIAFGKTDINRIISEGIIAGLNKIEESEENKKLLEELRENIMNLNEEDIKKYITDYQFIVANRFIRRVKETYDIDLKNSYVFTDGIFHWKKEFEALIELFFRGDENGYN